MSFTTKTGLTCVALLSLGVLQACQQAGPTRAASTTRLYATDQTGGAKACNVGTLTAPASGKSAPATMVVGNDGGWCGISVDDSGQPFGAGLLTERPAHGRVYIHTVGDATRIDYTPAAGYAGPDKFMVQLVPGGGTINAAVTVNK